MTLVDSSIWIDHFTNAESRGAKALDSTLSAQKEICILSLIATEVLMGFKSERSFRSAKSVLNQVSLKEISPATYLNAAILYRTLKTKGVNVRGAIDCIIAQTCLENAFSLLTLDRDFYYIAEYTPLRLIAL